jgi:hypothetical protein
MTACQIGYQAMPYEQTLAQDKRAIDTLQQPVVEILTVCHGFQKT